jgi:hypothetical protein
VPEVERGVRVVAALGVAPSGLELEAPVLPAELRERARVADERELPRGGNVCEPPGAQLKSRRWWSERFAVVADALAAQPRVVVTSTAGEWCWLVESPSACAPVVDLVGRTTFGA